MDGDRVVTVLHELNRKLLLVRTERKSSVRKEIIDRIILSEVGELKQLKRLLGIKYE